MEGRVGWRGGEGERGLGRGEREKKGNRMDEEEGEALILKDISAPEDKDAIYEIVDDERELDAVAEIFSDMLDDIDLEK